MKVKKILGLGLPLSGLLPAGGEGGLHAYSPLGEGSCLWLLPTGL